MQLTISSGVQGSWLYVSSWTWSGEDPKSSAVVDIPSHTASCVLGRTDESKSVAGWVYGSISVSCAGFWVLSLGNDCEPAAARISWRISKGFAPDIELCDEVIIGRCLFVFGTADCGERTDESGMPVMVDAGVLLSR